MSNSAVMMPNRVTAAFMVRACFLPSMDVRSQSDTDAMKFLLSHGMLTVSAPELHEAQYTYLPRELYRADSVPARPTRKGRFWVEAVTNTPLPAATESYEIPKPEEKLR